MPSSGANGLVTVMALLLDAALGAVQRRLPAVA